MTVSKIFFYFCLSFIAGIFGGSIIFLPHKYLWGLLLFCSLIILFSLFKNYRLITFLSFCLVFVLLGVLHYQIFNLGIDIKNNSLKEYQEKEITLVSKILTEPDIRENSVQLLVYAQNLIVGEETIKASGKVLVKTNKYPGHDYADVLLLTGLLKIPEEFEDFNYKDYLAKKGIFFVMDWPDIKIIQKNNYSNWWQFSYAQVLKFKNRIRENINQFFPCPASSLLGAMLLGDQSAMPQSMKDKLNLTGLRHITAISGMNIALTI